MLLSNFVEGLVGFFFFFTIPTFRPATLLKRDSITVCCYFHCQQTKAYLKINNNDMGATGQIW